MLGTSRLEYLWVVTWAVILHSIGPVSLLYCVVATLIPKYLRLPKYLEYWALIETLFYFLTLGYLKYYLQSPAIHPPLLEKEERIRLFRRCFENSQDLDKLLSRWFLGTPVVDIKRENMKEWLRWAFLNTAMVDPTQDDELETYLVELETKLGTNFAPGRADVKSIRLTLDKVEALHRSLTWYLCIFVVDILTHAYMYNLGGFDFYRGSIANSISIIPPRPQALMASYRSPTPNLSYWHRPHTSQKELPIVFLHGIGVGLYPYMQLLKEVNVGRRDEDGMIGILAVEILPISSRICHPLPRKENMCQQLESVLDSHGFDKFILVSHSLTVRTPQFANEWLLWYFGSKDIGVAHTLSRTFFWSQNILWKEDLLVHQATVFLSAKDSVINAPHVRRYLQDVVEHVPGDKDEATYPEEQVAAPLERGCVDVIWCAGLDHGQVFDLPAWRERLKLEILRKARYAV
ncbi:hypothetical protein LTR34_001806 [Exophiala xenobiotica]|nr:hypothetical protein LTR34_001806 [Exophiala xenobiotica]KAK5544237.1 hypothetical protein LTR23_004615 [Chaetothyriales sp. CCFEE 6169]